MADYESIRELDYNDETGERLVEVEFNLDGETFVVSMIVNDDEEEFATTDWQGEQPKSFDDVATGMWEFINLEDILYCHA